MIHICTYVCFVQNVIHFLNVQTPPASPEKPSSSMTPPLHSVDALEHSPSNTHTPDSFRIKRGVVEDGKVLSMLKNDRKPLQSGNADNVPMSILVNGMAKGSPERKGCLNEVKFGNSSDHNGLQPWLQEQPSVPTSTVITSISLSSPASAIKSGGVGEIDGVKQINMLPGDQQVQKFLDHTASDDGYSRRLTPAGSIEHLIRNYEWNAVSGTAGAPVLKASQKPPMPTVNVENSVDTHVRSNSETFPNSVPKVLPARSPHASQKIMNDAEENVTIAAIPSSPILQNVQGLAGGLVKERRERVEQLIRRSKELAKETSLALSKERLNPPTKDVSISLSAHPHNEEDNSSDAASLPLPFDGDSKGDYSAIGARIKEADDEFRELESVRPSVTNILEPSNATKAAMTTVNLAHSVSSSVETTIPTVSRSAPSRAAPSKPYSESAEQLNRLTKDASSAVTGAMSSAPSIVKTIDISARSLEFSKATSLPTKSPNVKSIDELRARHAQFKGIYIFLSFSSLHSMLTS